MAETYVPWGYGGKIPLSAVANDPMIQSLAPGFRENIIRLITENPTIGVGGADRDTEEVLRLWKQRYAPTDENIDITNPKTYNEFKKGRLKEYEGKIYRLKKGMAPSATPNASWHTGGFAVDFVGDSGLAAKLADQYGITQVDSTGENWHFQPKGTPDGRRVIDFIKKRYNRDILEKPLDERTLKYINDNFASNAPSHPASVLSMIDSLLRDPVRDTVGSMKSLKSMDSGNPQLSNKKTQSQQKPKSRPADGRSNSKKTRPVRYI